MNKIAVVTGASSEIAAVSARALTAAGFTVYLGERRADSLASVAAEIGGHAIMLDVTDAASVLSFAEALPEQVHVLVNNAGSVLGLNSIIEFDEKKWLQIYQSNVLGLARIAQALYPKLQAAKDGHLIHVGSLADFETYAGGGYASAKQAARAITETLRLEWLGQQLRVTTIDPGIRPPHVQDIADAVVWAATRPAHVSIEQIVIRCTNQARADRVNHRNQD